MTVLLIYNSPDNIGDRNQALAVARLLAANLDHGDHPAEVIQACINPRARLRPHVAGLRRLGLFRLLGPANLFAPAWKKLFHSDREPVPAPRLIVSRLGKSEHASAALASHFRVPNVHVGEPRNLHESHFSLVVSTSDPRPAKNRVFLETVPSHIAAEDLDREGAGLRQRCGLHSDSRVWCLLIGGDAGLFRYTAQDWTALARIANEASRRLGVHWVVSTSRRTGANAEAVFRQALDSRTIVVDATWWSHAPRPSLPAYVGAADLCIVTADSQSMMSNCVAAAKPTFAYRPESLHDAQIDTGPDDIRILRFLDRLEAAGRIRIMPLEPDHALEVLSTTRDSIRLIRGEERWDNVLIEAARKASIVS